MKFIVKTNKVEIPDGVTVDIKCRRVTVKGQRGSLTKDFKHIKVEINQKTEVVKGKTVRYLELNNYLTTYKQSAILFTVSSHIESMIKGVTKGFRYKMLCVKKHFPITVNVENNKIEVKNFIGCKEVILVDIAPGVTVTKNEKNAEGEIWLEGNDINAISLNCSRVNQSCNVGNKDKRKFLDGIYVSEKGLIA